MSTITVRSLAVVAAVALAVGVPGLVMGLHLGLNQAQFAAQGDTTLRAAPYAFAIWGPIYIGLMAYGAYQWNRETPAITAFGWPSVGSALACAAWIVTTALDWRWASVVVIAVGAAAAASGVLAYGTIREPTRREVWLVIWPNALLAGWLVLAAALALVTVATAQGVVSQPDRETWAICGIGGATLAALVLAIRSRLVVVLAPVVWGLVAAAVAERAHQPRVTLAAAVAVVILTGVAAAIALRPRGRSPSPQTTRAQRPSQSGA